MNPHSAGDPRQLDDELSPPAVAAIVARLRSLPPPLPRPAHQAQVLAASLALLPRPKTRLAQLREWYPWALLTSQLSILRRELWLASALVLTLGLLATLAAPGADGFLFSALAPLVAALGVAALYTDISQSMLEIEDATRASGTVLLLARLTLVFGFNLAFGLASSVVIALVYRQLPLAPLILSWLAPMTFLCGLAFFLSLVSANPLLASGSSLLLWLIHLLWRPATGAGLWWPLAALLGLSRPSARPILMLAGVLLVAAAIWLFDLRRNRATS